MTFLPVLYAETHYRLPFLFNLLSKKEPEIIADLPYRITLPNKLPILILIKDAHRFPVTLLSVKIFIDAQEILQKTFNSEVNKKFQEWILDIDVSRFASGWHEVQVKMTYQVRGRKKSCFADNYRTTSHAPFRCFFAAQSLPKKPGFYAGDFHSHSIFTEDQIEFGASLQSMQHMARSTELDFFCVTDHSYDLDDHPDDYLQNHPSFPKWQNFLQEVNQRNSESSGPLIIPGEEVSVRNAKDQTVHLLVLNHPRFIPGSGDSGDHWFKNKSEHSIAQALRQLAPEALSLPAHPAQPVPFSQSFFINRGPWRKKDLLNHAFHGLQMINGGQDSTVEQAIKLWTSLLLEGKPINPAAGNDAHGHFNRVREMAIPFVNLREHLQHIFGQWRTVLYCTQKPQNPDQLMACFRNGRLFLSNGPFIEIIGYHGDHPVYMGQKTARLDAVELEILASAETGFIQSVEIMAGFCSDKKERVIWKEKLSGEPLFQFSEKISLPSTPSPDYIRAQTKTEFGLALTNFIWIEH